MKAISLFFAALIVAGQLLANDEITRVRTFVVNWDSTQGYDGDVQVCDDNYFGRAEILVPENLTNAVEVIAKSCPNMKLESVESVYQTRTGANGKTESDNYTRVRLQGTWDCEVNFEKPLTNWDKKPAKFTVSLGDGC